MVYISYESSYLLIISTEELGGGGGGGSFFLGFFLLFFLYCNYQLNILYFHTTHLSSNSCIPPTLCGDKLMAAATAGGSQAVNALVTVIASGMIR